uniref:Secreted protein n=1 Tax=Sus scrofa TaxID=9823 RepID=A0A8D0LL97_PIG
MPLASRASDGLSGSIISSVLVFFFRACSTFMNDPSACPRDVSLSVKKEETGSEHGRLMGQLLSHQPRIPGKHTRQQQTSEGHLERRQRDPHLDLRLATTTGGRRQLPKKCLFIQRAP